MNTFYITLAFSIGVTCVFFVLQWWFYKETKTFVTLYKDFFKRKNDYFYSTSSLEVGKENVVQLDEVGADNSDLNMLIGEINHYIAKTKGTTDFSIIQNKVERKIAMRRDQALAKLSFPTHLGLMGTFLGVFLGIITFLWGFDGVNGITDESIQNLLAGVLVSMSTSFFGLLLTTINNAGIGKAQKNVEETKNEFYDYIQTELMPSLDVSLFAAITKLHSTVDKFEPAFENIINKFQITFDRCTSAFGETFEQNVKIVSTAVQVMGQNMDKINRNTQLQDQILNTLKSDQITRGMEKYIEAANHFASITKSLNKFEEARRMMLAATQEAINYQEQYNEMLTVPREVAVRINQILDRIKTFEENVNNLGNQISHADLVSGTEINAIKNIINVLENKKKIADKFIELSDERLNAMFNKQTEVIDKLNKRYEAAIIDHMDGFAKMLEEQTNEVVKRQENFKAALEAKFNIEDIRKDFSQLSNLSQLANLKLLSEIFDTIKSHIDSSDPVKSVALTKKLEEMSDLLKKIEEKKTSIKLF